MIVRYETHHRTLHEVETYPVLKVFDARCLVQTF